MNLIEAIKSGRPFRRNGIKCSRWYDGQDRHLEQKIYSVGDILADDYEIQAEPVVFESVVEFYADYMIRDKKCLLTAMCGKRVRCTVEVIE